MGSAKKDRAQAKRAAKQATGPGGRPGKPGAAGGVMPMAPGIFAGGGGLGTRTAPFGADGPILELQRRSPSTITMCVHGFWTLFMLFTLCTLGSSSLSLLSNWVWLLVTLFATVTFAGYFDEAHYEAWLIFWSMTMLHGLLWLQILLVPFYGAAPGGLWGSFGDHSGEYMLMAQLGAVPLLLLPLVSFLAYVWFERRYLQIIFYDFTNQLEKQHRIVNMIFHVTSPSLPLAIWAYCFNPKIFNDLPRWPGVAPVALLIALFNGLLLHYFRTSTEDYIGSVRWLHGVWLVWRRPAATSVTDLGDGKFGFLRKRE